MAKVMIIDDDIDLLETLKDALSTTETSVVALDTTDGAVAAALEERPDLFVLDAMFPENPAAGFDLAREIRATKELREVPIILLTAINREFPGDLSAEDMGDEWFPVQELLEKPVDLDVLRAKVAALLPGGKK